MTESPVFLIYTDHFGIDKGGKIFLYRLVHELRKLGEEAHILPMAPKPPLRRRHRPIAALYRLMGRQYSSEPDTPFGPTRDLELPYTDDIKLPENAIVLYTEFHEGNPLGAKRVARWLLFRLGYLGRPTDFPKDDLFFTAGSFSDDEKVTGGAQLLQLFWTNPIYQDWGRKKRSGSCYMVRKAEGRDDFKLVHPLENSRQVDGLSHEELVRAFNECETFYCYDDASMYSQYAALCGCDSIVIPWHFETRAEWSAIRPITKYGVGYGLDDVEHARKTRHLLRGLLEKRDEEALQTVRDFVLTSRRHFGFADPQF